MQAPPVDTDFLLDSIRELHAMLAALSSAAKSKDQAILGLRSENAQKDERIKALEKERPHFVVEKTD